MPTRRQTRRRPMSRHGSHAPWLQQTNLLSFQAYPGDDNELLKSVQLEQPERRTQAMFDTARQALAFADALMDTQLLVARKASSLAQPQTSVLRDAYAILAGYYRHLHDDFGQLELWPRLPVETRYRVEWTRWYGRQLEALGRCPEFVRNAVDAVVFRHAKYGQLARHSLGVHLIAWCAMPHWGVADGFLDKYGPSAAEATSLPNALGDSPLIDPADHPGIRAAGDVSLDDAVARVIAKGDLR